MFDEVGVRQTVISPYTNIEGGTKNYLRFPPADYY
jgi:hypothetical protein